MGQHAVTERAPTGSRFIDALPQPVRQALATRSRRVDLASGDVVLRQAGPRPAAVHFPVTSVLSLVTRLRDGLSIELSTVGNEGMTGAPLLLGETALANAQCVCQVPGAAVELEAGEFLQLVERHRDLRDLCLAYIGVLLTEMGQSVACARLHRTRQRCARWLLLAQDRVHDDRIHVTHESLGSILGTRRETVSQAVESLQGAGLIHSRHGNIEILDRGMLQREACECYAAMREAVDRLFTGPATRAPRFSVK